ncbi:transcriptional regulator ATRX [Trichonephila clavata]|uniref:Transcriptional regulator ATRX n=1 Tax=Trichonephila clavata TaxID=2740835 RepID=A0A8X6M087_TRICU|nr:transcriptional regulator ATRX [Trichonephila clavata]
MVQYFLPLFDFQAPRKKKISESSSSICLSSSGEETEPNMKLFKFRKEADDANTAAKNEILNSDVSIFSAESEEDSEPQKKKSKKKKVHSGSSDDFQPRKKKKYDKLLHKRLISDDDDDKDQKMGERKPPAKRRAIASDDSKSEKKKSDLDTTTSDSEEDKPNKKKRRKRIKIAANSSSSDEKEKGDGASQNTPGKGRKNIKKILSKEDLTVETKEAQNIEKERRKRVQERQKLYNIITDTSADGNEIITRKMVLEIDPDSKEEIVEIHPDIIEKLKPHQVKGVKFMWECTIESVKRLEKEPGSGCILAHCMGLGKTLQVIAFLHTCLTNKYVKKHIKTAMVVCPYNTVLNWSREFDHWLKLVEGDDILVHELTVAKDNYTRLDILNYWKQDGGVLIISYDLFRSLASSKKIKKLSSKSRNKILEHLIDPGPDIVICDEGHILKNVNSAISKACAVIATQRRIVLTGTPLQNNLLEYHCMLSFVKPHLLGTPKEFRNRFVNPIMNGQYDDSNEYDVKRMKKRIHILHKLLEGCVQRCDYSALTKFLPPKHEFVISVKLSETQIKMYRWYLDNLSRARTQGKIQGSSLFMDYNVLRNLCAHPFIVRRSFERLERQRILKEDNESDFINDTSDDSKSTSSKSDNSDAEEVVKVYRTRSRRNESGIESNDELSNDGKEEKHWYDDFISEEDNHNIEISGKIILLADILKECEAIGDKVIVFSQSLLTFDLLEDLLSFLDRQPVSEEDKQRDVRNSWSKNVDYFRMDGTTSAEFRKQYIDHFNDPANDRARLFLVSTKAGGLGTNLVGANRVIMLDASWNPSHDVQAIFRVYRFGQNKPVYIYRLLAQGTMEEKIYDRQVTKLSLSIRVVDEQQIDRHFNAAELAELYNFEPESQSNRPTPIVPKDTLLAEMLIKHTDWIVTYHEHDSLLQNETEEDLTEEERKAAWTEYENEREGRFIQNEEMPFDEDMKEFCKEPDFTEANYDGSLIPPVKTMIENIIARLKQKYPISSTADLRKKLLTSLFGLRAVFQEKHVKILRMKQEYVAKGSVPVVVNKYLEELNGVVKNLSTHYDNVSVMVTQDNKAAMQAQMQQQQQQFQQAQMQQQQFQQAHMQQQQFQQAQNPRFVGVKPPFARYNVLPNRPSGVPYVQMRPPYIPRYGQFPNANVAFNNMVANMNLKHAQANAQAYATFAEALKKPGKPVNIAASNVSQPQTVVTEVDKDEPVSNDPKTNPHSTVVIEEIE